ncbi:hypothetical protein [Streptomyces sp. NPDC003077]|uniref:hypothetical protein n=1 Tax=Streptomyces sp. NPDC003077 TaxID=3154443 RepID=UPI0033A19647
MPASVPVAVAYGGWFVRAAPCRAAPACSGRTECEGRGRSMPRAEPREARRVAAELAEPRRTATPKNELEK